MTTSDKLLQQAARIACLALVALLLLAFPRATAYAGELRAAGEPGPGDAPAALALQGSGTEGDPYLIGSADDYALVRDIVNGGESLAGVHLRQTADIELPSDWVPIGCTKDGSQYIQAGANLNAFSGMLDGGGFTLTVPRDGLPLLGYVKEAEVHNLSIYGEQIAGAGLVNKMSGVGLSGSSIILDGVVLKSGSRTLRSGLIDGDADENPFAICSNGFRATIRNCVIESGVTIGYSRRLMKVGGFAGRFQGTIENCVCDAKVQGVEYIGGIIAQRDNAMGLVEVLNCTFGGSVSASGEHVGGIVGAVYDNSSAPNGVRPWITGCSVSGTVTGYDKVGGILGDDNFTAQAWNEYAISGNRFVGTVRATASDAKYVGGIIGFYRSLNRFDDIHDNYFATGCGAEGGIGGVQYVDTNCEAHETASGALYFNTGAGVSACPEVSGCAWHSDYNRTDDPLGADAAKLCYSDADVADPEGCVFITIADDGKVVTSNGAQPGVVMSRVPVKLADLAGVNLEDAGLEGYAWVDSSGDEVDETVLKLFLYVLSTYHADGYSKLVVEKNPGSMYIEDGFWDHNYNFTYYVNGEYPMGTGGQGATADRIRLEAGDWVDVAMFSDRDFWWREHGGHAYFLDPATGEAAGRLSAVVGQPVSFIVATPPGGMQGIEFDGSEVLGPDDAAYKPVPGLAYYCGEAYDAEAPASARAGVSADDGACEFTFERPGLYTVWTDGYVDERGIVISSPAVATVQAVKPADYAAVDAAMAQVPADLSGYTASSVAALRAAMAAVDRDLTALGQSEVDAMAAAVDAAVAGLVRLGAQAISASDRSATYGCAPFALGARASGGGALTFASSDPKVATVDAKGTVTVNGAGSATVTVRAAQTDDFLAATKTVKVTVAKAPNGLSVKAAKKVLSAKRAKKAVFKASKAFKVSGNASGGKLAYKLAKVPKKAKKYVKLAKAGKITVKKGCPKGTYKIKVSVTQAETPNYQGKAVKGVVLKIRVK